MEKHYRDRDLAEAYGVSRSTIRRWVSENRLPPPTKIGPKASRWRESDIQSWEQAGHASRAGQEG